jgi:hypothetical protein
MYDITAWNKSCVHYSWGLELHGSLLEGYLGYPVFRLLSWYISKVTYCTRLQARYISKVTYCTRLQARYISKVVLLFHIVL